MDRGKHGVSDSNVVYSYVLQFNLFSIILCLSQFVEPVMHTTKPK